MPQDTVISDQSQASIAKVTYGTAQFMVSEEKEYSRADHTQTGRAVLFVALDTFTATQSEINERLKIVINRGFNKLAPVFIESISDDLYDATLNDYEVIQSAPFKYFVWVWWTCDTVRPPIQKRPDRWEYER